MDDNVIICRCQETTYGEIVKAIEDGAISVTGVKKRVGQIISEKTGIPVSELLPDTKRAPVRPVDAKVFLK